MAPIHLIYCGRSDGVVRVGSELNRPTPQQLTRTTNQAGTTIQYTEVPIDNPKSFEWRRKLALFLMRVAGPHKKRLQGIPAPMEEEPTDHFILADFPENYKLYEHCRVQQRDKANTRNDRRDYYLYGHPGGNKCRYRSPNDFASHLIWLMLDPSGDREACTCKNCSTDKQLKELEEFLAELVTDESNKEQDAQVSKRDRANEIENKSSQGLGSGAERQADTVTVDSQGLKRTLSAVSQSQLQGPEKKRVNSGPAPSITTAVPKNQVLHSQVSKLARAPTLPPAPSTPPVLNPAPLAEVKDLEQGLDLNTNSTFLYREGEVVWYLRGNAFGLAVILARNTRKVNGQNDLIYSLQPLSYPSFHPKIEFVNNENEIKPWLSFSVPPAIHTTLRDPAWNYDNVDWEAMLKGFYGDGNTEVDASIFSAKAVDFSYTPIHPLTSGKETASHTLYNGMYLGGEKIWVGEAIRLRNEPDYHVMVLNQIIESKADPNSLIVCGDIYNPKTVSSKGQPPRYEKLPNAVMRDLMFRNGLSITKRSQYTEWRIIQSQARLHISEVKGRWYPSERLLPIIDPQGFEHAKRTGDITDTGNRLNGRGEASDNRGKVGIKKRMRMQAFGASVPANLVLGSRELIDEGPRQPQSHMGHYPQVSNGSIMADASLNAEQTENDLAPFMDLDKIEDEETQASGPPFVGGMTGGSQF